MLFIFMLYNIPSLILHGACFPTLIRQRLVSFLFMLRDRTVNNLTIRPDDTPQAVSLFQWPYPATTRLMYAIICPLSRRHSGLRCTVLHFVSIAVFCKIVHSVRPTVRISDNITLACFTQCQIETFLGVLTTYCTSFYTL